MDYFPCERVLEKKHANLSQFLGQCSREERSYFKFATVRNPLDTAVTDYCKYQGNHKGNYTNPAMRIENGGHVTKEHRAHFDFIHNQNGSFADFLRRFHNRVYHNWFLLGAGQLDFVLRFENLAEDYKLLFDKLNLAMPRELPHVNPTKKKRNYEEFFPTDLIPFSVWRYGPFMDYWGYSFPETWGPTKTPVTAKLKFGITEGIVGSIARFMPLDADSRFVTSAKKLVEAFS